ncbi:MAG TPA: LD-carboxypeptidase [Firmicutes bacterium]|nr:LD-carboxypeptidase [Bacillota bacterium]
MIKPKAVKKGSTFGIVAPASRPNNDEALPKGKAAFEQLGFRTKVFPHVHDWHLGYLAGRDADRAADLNAAFADPEVDAIICVRGGYGCHRIIDKLDYDSIRKNPKLLIGYSDITALHVALGMYADLVTFHGPMISSEFAAGVSDFTRDNFLRAVSSTEALGALPADPQGPEPVTIRPGRAGGPLIGGNMALVTDLFGTPYEIDTTGKILLLEEIGDEPYQFDRVLQQLLLSGKAQAAAGIVIGQCADCEHVEGRSGYSRSAPLVEVVRDSFGGLNLPVLYNVPFGHIKNIWTLPIGVRATLDADAKTLSLDEPGVA